MSTLWARVSLGFWNVFYSRKYEQIDSQWEHSLNTTRSRMNSLKNSNEKIKQVFNDFNICRKIKNGKKDLVINKYPTMTYVISKNLFSSFLNFPCVWKNADSFIAYFIYQNLMGEISPEKSAFLLSCLWAQLLIVNN